MLRKNSTKKTNEALLGVAGGSSSASSSGRASPLVDGSGTASAGGSGKHAKPSSWRAATHIGSVVDDWPMYSAQASDYLLGPPIGFGASSVVYQASFLPLDGRPCAVKVIDLEAFGRDIAELRRETQLMSLSKHPNVLRVRGCWVEGSKLHIAARFMSSGSMLDIMRFSYPDGLEESVIATVLKQALEGLNYLHINGWLHRDLKAANMLVDEDGTVLLGDFGVGVYLDEGGKAGNQGGIGTTAKRDQSSNEDAIDQAARKSFVGTPCWMAPEVVERKSYGAKADIWSFGITALELSSGRAPHSRLPPVKVLMRTLQDEPPTLDRTSGAYKYSKVFDDFVKQCLHKDPSRRPSAAQLLSHPFFKQARPNRHLVNTILAGLPPLAERQQQARHMSLASVHNQLSWDFNTTTHGTNSRLTTPFHERMDPFLNFSGVVASPRGSVRSSRVVSAIDGNFERMQQQDSLDASDGDSSLLSALPPRSRSPSGDYALTSGNASVSKSNRSSRRRSRTQRSMVSFEISEEGDQDASDAFTAPGHDSGVEEGLATSTSELASSKVLPPIEELRVDSGDRKPGKSDGELSMEQAALKPSPAGFAPVGSSHFPSTPPLIHDSSPSSKAESLESGCEAEPTTAARHHDRHHDDHQAVKASPPRAGKTREALSKLFKRA